MKIDPELESLIPPLSKQESADLEASLVKSGRAIDAIKLWLAPDGALSVLDGHNRFRICTRLGLPFDTQTIPLPDKAAAKAWMLQYQRGRRNLSRDKVLCLAAMHGQPCPPGTLPEDYEVMKAAVAAGQGPDVLAGRVTLRQLINRTKPRKPHTPRAQPAAPVERTVEVITAEARAKQQAAAAKSDAKTLEKRLLQLESEVAFMHAGPTHAPVITTPSARPKSGRRIGDPVFLISDLHFGETVTHAESLMTNLYDLDVAAGRMRKCWDNMLWLRADMARNNTCDNTVIVLNGDIVSGDIHDELRETNDGGLRTQCDAAYNALAPGLLEFAHVTKGLVHVICIGGNHGRLTHKQHVKNGTQHSAEHIGVYDPLRRTIGAGPRGNIVWHIPESERHIFDIHGRKMSTQHGTMIKSQGGIGGTLVPMTRWVTRDKSADLYLFGHFHEADAYAKIIKNGALIGESAYTKWLGIEPGRPPEQVAFMLDADAGVRRFERVSVWCELDRENGVHK